MRFKRESDSHTYAILRWAASLLLYIWLVYYGFSKVRDVATRDFFLQTKPFKMSSDQMFESFPDVMFCTRGALVDSVIFDDFTMRDQLELSSVAAMNASPCGPENDLLTIFSIKDGPNTGSYFQSLHVNISPRNVTNPGDYSTSIATVLFIYSQANPYTRTDGSLPPVDLLPSLIQNSYIIQLEGASVRFDIEPKVTKVIRSDIWGLFGSTEAEQEYSIETLWIPLSTNNYSIIDVYLAQGSHNDTQILVTSIPRAFADWGGAFSVAWAIFFFFFGAPRVDPFGIISRLIGRKTQRYVTTFYGQWLSKPQESPFKSPTIQRTFTAQLSFLNEKTAQDMHSKSCKGSANTSLDITADDAADVAVREQQDESNIEVQMEQTADVKKLKADFDNLQKDFHKLHQLLKDYYLEMDLTVTETETEIESLPSTDVRRWYRRFWPHISPAGDGKSSPVTPPENAVKEA